MGARKKSKTTKKATRASSAKGAKRAPAKSVRAAKPVKRLATKVAKKPARKAQKRPATKAAQKPATKAQKAPAKRPRPSAAPKPRTPGEAHLRAFALSYPSATEDLPWGHRAFKVKGKVFCFLHTDDEGMSISVKLPVSNAAALSLHFAEPTGYGLGQSGWVSAYFWTKEPLPMPLLEAWIDESFCSIAPKRVVAELARRGAS